MTASTRSAVQALTHLRDRYGKHDLEIFLGLSLFLGGSGMSYPLLNGSLQILASLLLAKYLPRLHWRPLEHTLQMFLILLALICLMLIAQMIPLPPQWWHSLPGREKAVAVYEVLGWQGRWHAMSLAPDMTLKALLAMIPPVAMVVGTVQSSTDRKLGLLRIVVAIALVSTVFSAFQVAGGPVLYQTDHKGFGVGFFVNRNHQATFLLMAMVLSAIPGVIRQDRRGRGKVRPSHWPMLVMLWLVLVLGVVASTSRAGFGLLFLAMLTIALIMLRGRLSARALIPVLLGIAVVGAGIWQAPPTQRLLERYSTAGEDQRFQFWHNAWYASKAGLPWGYGFGSFPSVYQTVEALDTVSKRLANRAHNDFLEILMDGGLPAAVLLSALVLTLCAAAFSSLRSERAKERQALVIASAVALLILSCASIVDYPLRMEASAVVAALTCAMIWRQPYRHAPVARNAATPSWIGAFPKVLTACALILLSSLDSGSEAYRLAADPKPAAELAPWSSQAWNALANQGRADAPDAIARDAALDALRINPLTAPSLRTVGVFEGTNGRTSKGDSILAAAVSLSWQDPVTQLWAADRALRLGQDEFAVQRLDALLRIGLPRGIAVPREAVIDLMVRLNTRQTATKALVDALASRPEWRNSFFAALGRIENPDVPALSRLFSAMRGTAAPASMEETAPLLASLWTNARYAEAGSVFLGATGAVPQLANGEFDDDAPANLPRATPFAWQMPRLPGVRTMIGPVDQAHKGDALVVTTEGNAAGTVLSQTIVLPPGRYGFAAFSRSSDKAAPQLQWSARCLDEGNLLFTADGNSVPQPSEWSKSSGAIIVNRDCAAQEIALAITQPTPAGYTVQIDGVRLWRD